MNPHRIARALLAPLSFVAATGCNTPEVSVEVLPPRTSITCAAPGADDPALGRGLLDAQASDDVHGGYLADLRLVVVGADARVDGVQVRLTRDGDEIASVDSVPTGDVRLVGEGDDIRRAVVENVELVSRETAVELAADEEITDLEFAVVQAEIAPVVLDADLAALSSTFALDVCNGCLVAPPECAAVAPNPVCRVGQDVRSFSCAAVGGAP